ncbi:DUF4190 domain-containing protein [Paenibacillus sanguinis]|uniref:DUF4190 domain-containing protein n=1 Tax=Paenibacillus sanguinis TaxID=225906 RepID=UPI000365BB55|nr:DUF4190 domain-containing protein [Paenibacillus sanguinis]
MDQRPSNTPYSYSSFDQYPPSMPPAPAKTNGKSIASLVLGILSVIIPYFGFILGIIAIVLSSLSFREIKRTNEQGKGLGIAGLVCGIIGTVLYGIILLFGFILLMAYSSTETYSNF